MATSPTSTVDPFEWNSPTSLTFFNEGDPPDYTQAIQHRPSQDPIYNRWSWSPPQSWAVCQGPEYTGSSSSSSAGDDEDWDEEAAAEEFPADGEKQIERIMTEQCLVKVSYSLPHI
jgi:hypothetical protein